LKSKKFPTATAACVFIHLMESAVVNECTSKQHTVLSCLSRRGQNWLHKVRFKKKKYRNWLSNL